MTISAHSSDVSRRSQHSSDAAVSESATADLNNRLDRLWQLRLSQANEQVAIGVAELRAEWGLPLGRLDESALTDFLAGIDREHYGALTQTLLLLGSVARWQRDTSRAVEWWNLALIASQYCPGDHRTQYWLQQERGITHYIKGDYSSALDCFFAARRYANLNWLRLQTSFNALICFENLGLPHEHLLTEVKDLADTTKSEPIDWPNAAEIYRLITAFEQRWYFRKGDFKNLFATKALEISERSLSESYFLYWTLQLPYHDAESLPQQELQVFLERASNFHLGDYRTRTLLGLVHPDDHLSPKPMDIIARIYLWTWRWLAQPDEFSVGKIVATISQINLESAQHTMATEDLWLLKNACLWLGLFEDERRGFFGKIAQQLKPQKTHAFALLHLEHVLLEFFLAHRQGRDDESTDYRRALETHPLWDESSLAFKSLATMALAIENRSSTSKHKLNSLATHLRTLFEAQQDQQQPHLLIDRLKMRILVPANGEQIISESLCRAFDCLAQDPQIPVDQFMRKVFDISRYDAVIHESKIMNLLARMRQLLPATLRVGIKQSIVYARGDWDEVLFATEHPLTAEIRQALSLITKTSSYAPQEIIQAKTLTSVNASKAQLLSMLIERQTSTFVRKDVEDLLGVSRATASRILDELCKDELVISVGNARSRSYKLSASHGS